VPEYCAASVLSRYRVAAVLCMPFRNFCVQGTVREHQRRRRDDDNDDASDAQERWRRHRCAAPS